MLSVCTRVVFSHERAGEGDWELETMSERRGKVWAQSSNCLFTCWRCGNNAIVSRQSCQWLWPPFPFFSLFLSLSLSFSLSLSRHLPLSSPSISSPQREKRWSISSARGEKNSSSVSRGVSGKEREREGWDGALGQGGNGGRQRWRKGMDRHAIAAQSR